MTLIKNLKAVKSDIYDAIIKCSRRSLVKSSSWLSDLLISLENVKLSASEYPSMTMRVHDELDIYFAAKNYFDSGEYKRCSYFTKKCNHPENLFLHFYSRYVFIEKKRIENMPESQIPPDPSKNEDFRRLKKEMKLLYHYKSMDGFLLYLYGVVLKKLDLLADAKQIFLESLQKEPCLWAGWVELADLVGDLEQLSNLQLKDHWMLPFFLTLVQTKLSMNDEALDMYNQIINSGFEKSVYVQSQIAIVYHTQKDTSKAIDIFTKVTKMDPYRLESIDSYSNLLYVMEKKLQLAALSNHAVKVDKYRPETCCIIGNYYSYVGDHQKAVLYFQRALKLDPYYTSAWTLMGHEFMETKSTNAAIHCYRQAIATNCRDYRAWYGLGQTYEILKMNAYCVYYYKQAQKLRPNDSRMLVALGDTYEKLEKVDLAIKCYSCACNVGDLEGLAFLKLAKLYDRLGDTDSAAAAYSKYCKIESSGSSTELYQAFCYLANYYLKKQNWAKANFYASRCLESIETKDEGKSILNTIAMKRETTDFPDTEMSVQTSIGENQENSSIYNLII